MKVSSCRRQQRGMCGWDDAERQCKMKGQNEGRKPFQPCGMNKGHSADQMSMAWQETHFRNASKGSFLHIVQKDIKHPLPSTLPATHPRMWESSARGAWAVTH